MVSRVTDSLDSNVRTQVEVKLSREGDDLINHGSRGNIISISTLSW